MFLINQPTYSFIWIWQLTEEGQKVSLVTAELDDLREKLSQTAELEKQIQDLEQKLQQANAKSREASVSSPL